MVHPETTDHFSAIHSQDPNLKEHPEYKSARPTVCTIEEGEMLYIPSYAWHDVWSYPDQTTGMNLAVNYWFHANGAVHAYHRMVHQLISRSNEILDHSGIAPGAPVLGTHFMDEMEHDSGPQEAGQAAEYNQEL